MTDTTKSVFSLPYKVVCSKCGSEKMVRHEVLLKRLVKYEGTLEERFNQNQSEYLCQNCKREDKLKELESKLNNK